MTAMIVVPAVEVIQDATVETEPVATGSDNDLFNTWVELPSQPDRQVLRAQQLTKDIRVWTGWSQRRLASVLDVTHPTIRALEDGRPPRGDLYARLVETHRVIERVFLLAGRRREEADRILSHVPATGHLSAAELLHGREPSAAYLAALDAIRPEPDDGMMRGLWPAAHGEDIDDLATPDSSAAV